MADTEFKLSDEQLEFLKHHEIADETINGITTADAYNALKRQIEEDIVKSYLQSRLSGDSLKEKESVLNAMHYKELEKMVDETAKDMVQGDDAKKKELEEKAEQLKKRYALDISRDGNGEENQNTDADWIEEKRRYYQGLSERTKINSYNENISSPGFEANFNNATIHYTSPTHVRITPNAGLKVFYYLLNEDSNKGRPVNFAENLPREMKLRLYAATLICGNELGDNAPQELSAEDLKFIREELKDDPDNLLETFEKNYAKLHPEKEPEQERQKEDRSKLVRFEDPKVNKDVKQALEDQYLMAQYERDGKVKFNDKGEPIPGPSGNTIAVNQYKTMLNKKFDLADKKVTGKEFLAAKFKEDSRAFRVLAGDIIVEMQERAEREKEGKTKEEKDKIKTGLQEKIVTIRQKQIELLNHGELTEDDRKRRNEERKKVKDDKDNEMKKNLGLDGTSTPKPEDMAKYISENNITSFTYKRLGGDEKNVPAACVEVDKKIAEMAAKGKAKE